MRKKEQEKERFRKLGKKQFGNSSAKRFSKEMLAAWGDTTEDDEATDEEEVVIALMARSESDSDDEPLDSLAQLKEQVSGFNKSSLKELLFSLIDEYESVNTENCMLKDVCSDLKKDVRKLEHANEILKSEKLKVDEKTLILYEDFDKLKETSSMREEVFNTNLSKLKSESLQLKQKIESLICENHQLREKLKKANPISLQTGAVTVPQKRLIG